MAILHLRVIHWCSWWTIFLQHPISMDDTSGTLHMAAAKQLLAGPIPICILFWLVVWTPPLRNTSQLGWLFPIYGNIKKCSKPPAIIYLCILSMIYHNIYHVYYIYIYMYIYVIIYIYIYIHIYIYTYIYIYILRCEIMDVGKFGHVGIPMQCLAHWRKPAFL